MTFIKSKSNSKEYIIVKDKKLKFIIFCYEDKLYWIMLDYIPNNRFIVTKDCPIFWEFLTVLFHENHFKNCTFLWNSANETDNLNNRLKITKGENYFTIKFLQSSKDNALNFPNACPICFCLSGSRKPRIAESFSIFLHKLLNSD